MMKKILNRTVNTDFKHIISLDVLRNRAFYTTNREKDVKFNFTKFYSNADLLKLEILNENRDKSGIYM